METIIYFKEKKFVFWKSLEMRVLCIMRVDDTRLLTCLLMHSYLHDIPCFLSSRKTVAVVVGLLPILIRLIFTETSSVLFLRQTPFVSPSADYPPVFFENT